MTIVRPYARPRRLAAVLVSLLALAAAGGGTAWANAPKHRYVYEVTASLSMGDVSSVAVNPATNVVYVTTGLHSSVDAINGATNALSAIIVVPGAGSLAVDPVTNKIYVTRYGAVSVIDGATNQIIATVDLPGLPGGITDVAVNPATDTIYVSGSGSSSGAVSVINGATNTVTGTIAMPAGDSAVGLAADPGTNTVAVATQYTFSGGVLMINGTTHAVTTVDLLEPQYAVAADPSAGIYYSEGIGDLNTVNASTYAGAALANFPCPVGPCGGTVNQLAVDSALHVIYASFQENGSGVVLLYEGTTGFLYGQVPVPGAGPLAVNSVTHTAYVASSGYTLTVISRVWV